MNYKQLFPSLVRTYFDTRRNKRYGRDSMSYEMRWVSNLLNEIRAREDKTLRVRHNYAFLTSIPRWREIMATEFTGRVMDHEICEVAIPQAEKVLSPFTFNNRKGKGAQAAMNALIETITAVTKCDTEPCRIIKLDLKGYFPNARWDVAERELCKVLDLAGLDPERTAYLKWLTMLAVNGNPAAHCERRTPIRLWEQHIDPEKSLFRKPEGVGAAIGRLIWQTAMGLYINDEVRWLTEEAGLHAVCFVDDIVMVVPEHLHGYALAQISVLREKLAAKGVRLNERKFYDQPHGHGVKFLGSHIRPNRIHLNDKTYAQAVKRIRELNRIANKSSFIDPFLCSVNSYFGLLKQRTDYRRMLALRDMIDPSWWQYVRWDDKRKCVTAQPYWTWRSRMDRKYHLNLKYHGKRRTRPAA